jgi:hypothetical protein
VAIIDKSAIVLSLTAIDVTDAAIAKVDAALKPGTAGSPVPPAPPDPAPPEGTEAPPAATP